MVENSEYFPEGVNFELAIQTSYDEVLMAVWERGIGRTLACGSGATATVCAGIVSGKLKPDVPVKVVMEGGELVITVQDLLNINTIEPILIKGPAEFVYSGELSENIWWI